ncbi:MAG TPA: MBL fold metallo-hydrolase [Tepidiformaceae bacterium]|nr:MBL fold metallo-hydrolase [Tepidiformaceae bacterium]
MTVSIGFFGAAGTVTGSKYLVRSGDSSVLVDCGMFQGEKRLRELNWQPAPFRATEPSAALLTHAHVDHSGLLPRFVREGFRGPIYATPATGEMAGILLRDSARLQEEDAEYANRKGYSRHHPALPLYTEKDVERALGHFRQAQYRQELKVAPEITARFLNAGHILGSAFIELTCRAPHGGARIVFSGDLGRYGAPLHSDPDPLPECDVLVMESTYGDRDHGDAPIADQIEETFKPVLERRGIILVPAFAVARAQLVALILRDLIGNGRLPEVPIHIDSPMASDVTSIYNHYIKSESLDQDIPFTSSRSLFPANVRFHRTVRESQALNGLPGPRIIISSSGMLAGGRVLHHLKRLAGDRENLIALVGYQAAGTRGRDLVEGRRQVKVHGEMVQINARIANLHGLSAHADRGELIRWVKTAPKPPRAIYLVHGDVEPRDAMKDLIERELGIAAVTPAMGEEHDLGWLFRS